MSKIATKDNSLGKKYELVIANGTESKLEELRSSNTKINAYNKIIISIPTDSNGEDIIGGASIWMTDSNGNLYQLTKPINSESNNPDLSYEDTSSENNNQTISNETIIDGIYYGDSEFGINGIGYNIISQKKRIVAITGFYNYDNNINWVIPENVTYNGIIYSVEKFYKDLVFIGSSIKLNSKINIESNINCYNGLQNIYVDENNQYLSDIDGILYNKDKTELICVPKGKTYNKFVIPESVISLRYNDWLQCKVNILDMSKSNITDIDLKWDTFNDEIKEIIFPKNIEHMYINTLSYGGSIIKLLFFKSYHLNLLEDSYESKPWRQFANLDELYIYDSNPVNLDGGFTSGQYSKITLYVPIGCKTIYESTEGWNNFENIEEYDFSEYDE